jgi:hypothetical protein
MIKKMVGVDMLYRGVSITSTYKQLIFEHHGRGFLLQKS